MAVHWALTAFLLSLKGHRVQMIMDNIATMYYINKQGGATLVTLYTQALTLWPWCIHHHILLNIIDVVHVLRTQILQQTLFHFHINGSEKELNLSDYIICKK